MKPGMEAVVISVDEPQLRESLRMVNEQKEPFVFENIIHVNNVVPEFKANNEAFSKLSYEYAMLVGGDFILYEDAVQKAWDHMGESVEDKKIMEWNFGLDDTFLKRVICCCTVIRSEIFANGDYLLSNTLKNDTERGRKLFKLGYKRVKFFKKGITLGTHFHEPTVEQVAVRFYIRGVKCRNNERVKRRERRRFRDLYNMTKEEKYRIALFALEYGINRGEYNTSHNKAVDSRVADVVKSLWRQFQEWMDKQNTITTHKTLSSFLLEKEAQWI